MAPAGGLDGKPARVVFAGPRTRRQVALTFHRSGDPALASRLLDTATSVGVPISLFAVGRWLTEHPTLIQRILAGAGAAGYPLVVAFDVDPRDDSDPGADAVTAQVAAGLRPGSIVSLHTRHPGTITAFDPIVAAARARGLQPVLLHRLLDGRSSCSVSERCTGCCATKALNSEPRR